MKRSGIKLIEEDIGSGALIERGRIYRLRLNLWLNNGDPLRWERPCGFIDRARLENDGATLITDLRIDRESLFAGLFQGIEGMRIGGRRKLKISPHLAYGEAGLPARVPENAVIIADIEFIEERILLEDEH